MHLVLGCVCRENDSLDRFPILLTRDRFVAPERFQRHPSLEFRRKSTPFRHLVLLRYPVEYTLTSCPIFQDHLNDNSYLVKLAFILG
jgi:hypothetical protein